LSMMERQVEQMVRLVDDLLDVSRVTRDKIELRKERVDLAAVLNTAIETSRPLIDAAAHELTITFPAQPVYVDVDPARMAQVFSNLLNNSAKYTDAGGRIQIEARQQGENVFIAVRDNGVGIACDELAYVFDMFRQVDRSLERSQGGLGIGLTLVRRLVELHGGSVNALSEGRGKGSEFVIRLPVASAELALTPVPPTLDREAAPKPRVLVVDDNRGSRETLSALLQMKGHEVQTARDGQEAVDTVPSFLPDVILMDVGMPILNGLDATRRIRQMRCGADIFIVALTGWGQASDVQKSAEAGCSAHLIKPVDIAVLEELLANRAVSAV
jgi:CheY-like chemotaxis protein/two-component sensor histidine kinase